MRQHHKNKVVGFCMHGALLFAALLLGSPADALAAEAGHHAAPGLETLWLPFFNFTLYAVVLIYLYKKYGVALVRQRSVEIRERLNSAAGALADAQSKRELAQARLDEIDAEKAALVRRYEEEGAAMSRSIAANAKRQAERIAVDAARQVESELLQAQKQLHNEAVALAARLARGRLTGELSGEQDRLLRRSIVRDFVMQLQS